MAMQRTTVLLPTEAEAVAFRRARAASGRGVQLGVDATTPAHWVEGLWELWGDGRRPVSDLLRRAILLRVLREVDGSREVDGGLRAMGGSRGEGAQRETDGCLRPDAGVAGEAAQLVAALCGLPGFERAVQDPAARPVGLCPQEHALLDAVARYYHALDESGLVEPLRELPGLLAARPDAVPAGSVELQGLHALKPNLETVLRSLGVEADRGDGNPPLAAAGDGAGDVELCVRRATGPTAVAPQVIDAVLEAASVGELADGPVLVVAPDPGQLFLLVRADLTQAGVRCAVYTGRPFAQTYVGRALASARAVIYGDDPLVPPRVQAVDFATNPLSGADRFAALQLDTELRTDRLLDREQIRDLLERTCPDLGVFQDALENPAGFEAPADVEAPATPAHRADSANPARPVDRAYPAGPASPLLPARLAALQDALDAIEQLVCARLGDQGARCAQELRAVALLREACRAGVDIAEFVELAGAQNVPGPAVALPLDAAALSPDAAAVPDVLIVALNDVPAALAAYLPGCAVPQVIVAGATSADYAASAPHGAAVELAGKLGLPAPGRDLDQTVRVLRRSFAHLLEVATQRLTIVLPEHDGSGNPVRPAFFVEELLAARDARQAGDVRDEGCLGGNFGATYVPCERWSQELLTVFGAVDPAEVRARMRFMTVEDEDGCQRALPVLSPSQIEDYAACPYLWYMRRCLHVNAPDDELDAIARGRFVHQVLERFYRAAVGQGYPRVDRGNAGELAKLFAQVFDQTAAEQGEQRGLRYAACASTETYDLDLLKRALLANLRNVQAKLVPDHAVYRARGGEPGLEVELQPQDRIVFAGAVIRGTVDRVDASREDGTFVVVDYKPNVSADYDTLYPGDPKYRAGTKAKKMQADIYAAALARSGRIVGAAGEPLRPAGVLYLGYLSPEPSEAVRGVRSGYIEGRLWRVPKPGEAGNADEEKRCSLDAYAAHLEHAEAYIADIVARMVEGDVMPDPLDASSCTYCSARTLCPAAKGGPDD